MGGLNFDILVDEEDRVYILEIGARNGGNMIPELTRYCTGVDMVEWSIKAAMGEQIKRPENIIEKPYFSHYVIHSDKSGKVVGIKKSDTLKKHILHEHYNFRIGDRIGRYENSANRQGIMLLQYENKEEMLDLIYNMDQHLILQID